MTVRPEPSKTRIQAKSFLFYFSHSLPLHLKGGNIFTDLIPYLGLYLRDELFRLSFRSLILSVKAFLLCSSLQTCLNLCFTNKRNNNPTKDDGNIETFSGKIPLFYCQNSLQFCQSFQKGLKI